RVDDGGGRRRLHHLGVLPHRDRHERLPPDPRDRLRPVHGLQHRRQRCRQLLRHQRRRRDADDEAGARGRGRLRGLRRDPGRWIGDLGADPLSFALTMMAALLGAAIWLLLATRMGWPVSTTHAIIGGIVGAAVTTGIVTGTGGFEMVHWSEIGQIAISWVLSPLL